MLMREETSSSIGWHRILWFVVALLGCLIVVLFTFYRTVPRHPKVGIYYSGHAVRLPSTRFVTPVFAKQEESYVETPMGRISYRVRFLGALGDVDIYIVSITDHHGHSQTELLRFEGRPELFYDSHDVSFVMKPRP